MIDPRRRGLHRVEFIGRNGGLAASVRLHHAGAAALCCHLLAALTLSCRHFRAGRAHAMTGKGANSIARTETPALTPSLTRIF